MTRHGLSSCPLTQLSVWDAGRLIKARQVSPVELVEACLRQIEATQPHLFLYITILADEALAAARKAEAEIAAGSWKGPLHGVPFAVKDNYHVKGVRTTAGSRLMLDHVATDTATIVTRLLDAGAILLGKLNTWEFGTGNGEIHPDLPFPHARNPWNEKHFTGGSSTGAGAAVAAGAALFALGSDTGGSVRLPAAATGVQGMKATFGLISRAGILPNCWSSDVSGPLTWTTRDSALVLSAIAGSDPFDPYCVDRRPRDYTAGIDEPVVGIRVGVVRDFGADAPPFQPAVLGNLQRVADVLAGQGAIVREARLPAPLSAFRRTLSVINWSECYSIHETDFLQNHQLMGRSLRDKLMSGAMVRAADYLAALRHRATLAKMLDVLMHDYDALIMPTTTITAPNFSNQDRLVAFTFGATTAIQNVTGHPALSIASGFDEAGLPTAVQISGRMFDEPLVYRLAQSWEAVADPRSKRPSSSSITRRSAIQ